MKTVLGEHPMRGFLAVSILMFALPAAALSAAHDRTQEERHPLFPSNRVSTGECTVMHYRSLCRVFAVAACVLIAVPAWGAEDAADAPPPSAPLEDVAEDVADPADAQALIDAGRFEEAIVALRPLLEERPVAPNVLFLYGLASLEASQRPGREDDEREILLNEAIAAFHAMLVEAPGLVRVRLELARAFFLKGEDDLARRHFEAVLAGGVPDEVAANVNLFLNEIKSRGRWSFNVGAALAPDTNIGAGSEERTIYILGLPFERDAEELTASGVGLVLWGGAEYQYPMGPRSRLRAGANVYRREHSGSAFDEASLSLHVGPRMLIDGRTEASVLLTGRQHWTGTVKDHHALGGRIEAARRLTSRATLNGRVSLEDRTYRTRTYLDGTFYDLSSPAPT